MDNEIHLFLGSACITKKSKSNYPIGERHAILFYLRQPKDSDYNTIEAKKIIRESGLNKIEFTKAGKLDFTKVNIKNKEHYDNAIRHGSTIILYTDPI
ncbi:hypothetical protein [Mucilaginibacter arboris]|uniref:Uncharacterized protein n=1 Tax=Mucilaginibacter arboris TaxID=2682090 RepID=A0A7K1SZC1_9SPHI|nr:hypothetical protein [Mucilaginibacter arboris]MVN22665.1 hypothetical protein [Mucilaginibacter arboris]